MSPKGGLSILEAIENLNTVVDADSIDQIEVTEDARLVPVSGEALPSLADEQTVDAIKETFRTVHTYLQNYTKKMATSDPKEMVEGVNTIMVLVGEAAKKLDRYGAVFHERVSDFPEYKDLQSFYKDRVIRDSFKEFAKTPIRAGEVLPEQVEWEKELQELLKEEDIEEVAGVHILNDISVIKGDRLYELFYLKNEAGQDFFTLDLARNIKLACDFGEFSEEYFGDDPLLQIKNWEDKELHLQAAALLKAAKRPLEKFYAEAMKYRELEPVMHLHNACMALMLAGNQRNLIRQFSLKGCHLYFGDFLTFLRATLNSREFEKWAIYGPPAGKPFFQNLIDLVSTLCTTLFTNKRNQEELHKATLQLIARMKHKNGKHLSDALFHANHALQTAFKHHPNGPVFKALDIVRESEEERVFDPLAMGHLPSWEWSLGDVKILRLPSPTSQEWISIAEVVEEFKAYLHAMKRDEHLVVFNYQDRTSWKEHARCQALEKLAEQGEFSPHLSVITLASDTDFYKQIGAYEHLNKAGEFKEQLIDHFRDTSTGFAFPMKVSHELLGGWMSGLAEAIHTTFFKGKKELSYIERLDFIELAYHFIELKVIEVLGPSHVAFMSKDGLDVASSASVGLMAVIDPNVNHKKVEALLFGPTLMLRERTILPEQFDRLYTMIRLLEKTKDYQQAFKGLFRKVPDISL